MNSFLCLSLLVSVAAAAPKPQSWTYSVQDESVKPASWYDGSVSYVSSSTPNGYWPSYYAPSIRPSVEVSPKSLYLQKVQSVPVARSDASAWKVEPASWSDASYAPQWSAGYYSAGLPVAGVEKQIVAKKIEAPIKVDQVQPVADPTPKLISYSTEISHDVPAKKEEVASIVSARAIEAPVAPVQYSAWTGEVKPLSEVKPAPWAAEIKPAAWSYGPALAKPASWSVGPPAPKAATWASEVKPSSWSVGPQFPAPASWTAEIKPGSWASEVKPASWGSWSEAKPWSSYVSPVQPAFYGAQWAQPTVSTNAHHAISAPWSSAWSSAPVAWTEPIQKRSERKPFTLS